MKTNFSEYLAKKDAQKIIDQFGQDYKGKSIVLYGAGLFAGELIRHYDFSELNIIGVADIKFRGDCEGDFYSYKKFAPEDLLEMDFDVLLITTYDDTYIKHFLFKELLQGEEVKFKVKTLIRLSLFEYIKGIIKKEI